MQVKIIAERSKGVFCKTFYLHYSYHLSLRSVFSIFEWLLKTYFTLFSFQIPVAYFLLTCLVEASIKRVENLVLAASIPSLVFRLTDAHIRKRDGISPDRCTY